jgi:serine-type D-Ala-D-Ala carboxypeptidase (penicillin-binding protein 5/6)
MVGLASVVSGVTPAATAAPVTTTTTPLPPPKAWILVDGDTGNVVEAGNARARLPPASLTKVITALAAGNLAPDAPVTVSDRAAGAPADKLFMKPGQVWTADEMLHALLISSANDAAVALAEQIGKTVEGFQPVLARTATGLGMADSPILNDPAGLDGPDGVGGGNFVSARDLAIAGRALLSVPTLAAIVATPVYYFDGPDNVHHRLTNHNKPFLTTYTGAVGLKTGYTSRAGSCLMAAATVGGRTMLAVVLNSANPTVAASLLLDKGFATPVAAETGTDRLPAVNQAALRALPDSPAVPSPTLAPRSAAGAAGSAGAGRPADVAAVAGSGAVTPGREAPSAGSGAATMPWGLPLAVALTVLLGLTVAIRRRGRLVRERRRRVAGRPFETMTR